MGEELIPVLIVDDNQNYRQAFSRNLVMMDFEVYEADNSVEAMKQLEDKGPMVMVTDLQMRTEREGLDLILEARDSYPLLPIIMISAVGSFEEGALAQKLGAAHVIHKSSIEDEIEQLYDRIRQSWIAFSKNNSTLNEVNAIADDENAGNDSIARLQEILAAPDVIDAVKSSAYDLLMNLQSAHILADAEERVQKIIDEGVGSGMQSVEELLKEEIPNFDGLDAQSKEAISSAELLYNEQHRKKQAVDFSRNIGFSYCFAVENEVKKAISRRLTRFLNNKDTYKMIKGLIDEKRNSLDIYFHKFLLQYLLSHNMEITTDNVKQTFDRILQHQSRYKPDGLKAVGIVIFIFGSEFTVKATRGEVVVKNPLNLKFANDCEVKPDELAEILIGLQHYRNPYIHPEISEMENISKVRESALKCLSMIRQMV